MPSACTTCSTRATPSARPPVSRNPRLASPARTAAGCGRPAGGPTGTFPPFSKGRACHSELSEYPDPPQHAAVNAATSARSIPAESNPAPPPPSSSSYRPSVSAATSTPRRPGGVSRLSNSNNATYAACPAGPPAPKNASATSVVPNWSLR